jgi:hypothetical protein
MWIKVMMKIRTNIKLFSLFSFIFFAASLGSFKGLVLCYGADGHIHTEITFNGVDCGHFPQTASEATASGCLTKFNPTPHATHCISCIDIPLSFDYSLKKFDHTKTQRTASKLRNIASSFRPVSTNPLITASIASSLNQHGHTSPTLTIIHNTILLI